MTRFFVLIQLNICTISTFLDISEAVGGRNPLSMPSRQQLAASTSEGDRNREMSNPGTKKCNCGHVKVLQTRAETFIKINCLL
jgi:hypothetical protein